MGFYITLGGFISLTLLFVYYLLRQNRIGLSSKELFQEQLARLTQEKIELEDQLLQMKFQLESSNQKMDSEKKEFNTKLEMMIKYQSLVEETEEFLFEMDHTGKFTYANPTMLNRLGYNELEIIDIQYKDLASPEHLVEIRQFYARQYHQKQADSYGEWHIINRFGESVWVGLRVHITYNEAGLINSVKGIARDLSVQKVFENRDRADGGFFQKLFQSFSSPVLVFRLKPTETIDEGSLFWANEPALDLMDLDWFEVKGISLKSISSELAFKIEECLSSFGSIISWQTKKRPDTHYKIIASKGNEWLWVCLNDFTPLEKKLDKERLQANFFKSILDNLEVDVAVFSPDQKYLYVNPSAVKSDDVRAWMIGKTDEEYVKTRNKNLRKALHRMAKFMEVKSLNRSIMFNDYLQDKQKTIQAIIRRLTPLLGPKYETEMIIASGTNVTENFVVMEKYFEILDTFRFSIWISNHSTDAPQQKFAKDELPVSLKSIENRTSKILGGLQSENHFFTYPTVLSSFSQRLAARSSTWENIDLLVLFSESETEILFIPRTFVKLCLEYLNGGITTSTKIRVTINHIQNGSGNDVLQITIDTDSLSGVQLDKFNLRANLVAQIWESEGGKSDRNNTDWVLEIPLLMSKNLQAGELSNSLHLLKGKTILLGPEGNKSTDWIRKDLISHGAGVEHFFNLESSGRIPDFSAFHLLIWVDSNPPPFGMLDVNLMRKIGLKLLWFGNGIADSIPIEMEDLVILMPLLPNGNQIIEEVWIHARSVQLVDDSEFKPERLTISFEKLLEITQGDKQFMSTLFQTYFSSMDECKVMFRKHLLEEDLEGLKFLLHKVRATINTFEIKELEIFLTNTIQLVDLKKSISDKKKNLLLTKVAIMCESVESQIRDFAKKEKITI